MRNPSLYLQDILNAIDSIESFVGQMTLDEFKSDDRTNSAVIRKFEIIGEAAKAISDDIRKDNPSVPWKEMAGMRDRLTHAYFGIDFNLVWAAIKERIPRIRPSVQKALDSLSNKS